MSARFMKEAEEGEDLIAIHYRKADNGASMQMRRNTIMIGDTDTCCWYVCACKCG